MQNPKHPLLLVDDEESWLRSFSLALRSGGYDNLITCTDPFEVKSILETTEVEAIVADMAMPGLTGEDLIRLVSSSHPEIPIIVITGINQVETAVNCIKAGAFDFFVKTSDKASLVSGIRHAVEIRQLKRENSSLKSRFLGDTLENPSAFAHIITASKQMRSIFQYVEAIAETLQPVLITGESGAGKELIARAVHDLSGRNGEFVAVNVAGLDENIFDDTLFGHKKGAFTGADRSRPGLVEKAADGTLFLDEIGDLPLASQVKLLRLLQEREYRPIGSDLTRKSSARIVAATNKAPADLDHSSSFRSDLYYRLKAHHVHIPPLRERPADIPLLIEKFCRDISRELKKPIPSNTAKLFDLLRSYQFPGNIRELKMLVYDAVSSGRQGRLCLDQIRQQIKPHISLDNESRPIETGAGQLVSFGATLPTIKQISSLLVAEAMQRTNNNQAQAARLIGISRQALNKRLHNQNN